MNDLTTITECAAEISRDNPGFGSNEKFDAAVKKSPLRVLVFYDEALIRWSVAETLTDLGVEV